MHRKTRKVFKKDWFEDVCVGGGGGGGQKAVKAMFCKFYNQFTTI